MSLIETAGGEEKLINILTAIVVLANTNVNLLTNLTETSSSFRLQLLLTRRLRRTFLYVVTLNLSILYAACMTQGCK
jgi:hypothetical protein